MLRDSERRHLRESQRIAGVSHFRARSSARGRTYWADNMYELHGVTPAQYPGRPRGAARFDPIRTSAPSLQADYDDRCTDGVKIRDGRAPDHSGPTGERRIIRYEWRPVPGPDSRQAKNGMFGVAQDITAIRKAEAALRQNEQQLRDLLDCSSDFIWETNADGVIDVLLFAAAKAPTVFDYAIGRQRG